ncbi:SPOR domain-containing protein [uncultured Piscinibacter sp.]|uniref:SPOR domain-containing protein n=1 Tax=uncultured Piscinibacter sp. TaxID=1131835 RepID=UPI00261C6698|nr:SPOR domain-containing protein [uncultured Piscinibacter sp.]
MKTLLIALSCTLMHGLAAAQDCEGMGMAGSRIVKRDTRDAGDAIEKLVRQAGTGADLRAIRLQTLKYDYPKADVDVTTRRMLRAYCEVVWADGSLGDDGKAARVQAAEQEMTRAVEGPSEVARTNSRIRSSRPREGGRILLAMAPGIEPAAQEWLGALVAQAPSAAESEFLRDPPSFVNDSNKYFVIVGSAGSEDEAIRLMNRLKAKAPKYDFVVYLPYGANPFYGVMMATWTSREVAQQALREARASVAPDAYLWACRSTGESC